AFAWRSMRERETITSFLMEDVESASALDDRTVEIRLREPRNYFPYILTSPWSFPWPRHKCEQLGDDWRKPENLVGNGPFVLAEFDDEHALLKPNRYWNGPRGTSPTSSSRSAIVGPRHTKPGARGASTSWRASTRASSTPWTPSR